jgi:hypothetical protein
MNFSLRTLFAYTLLAANALALPMTMARFGYLVAILIFSGLCYLACIVATGRWRLDPPA